MVRAFILAILVLLLVGCGPTKIKCDPIVVEKPVTTIVRPADPGPRPVLETKKLTDKSSGKQIITATSDDLAHVIGYAQKLECALYPFQVAAGFPVDPAIVKQCKEQKK